MKTNKQLRRANTILGTDCYNWIEVSECKNLSEDFIDEFSNYLDWRVLSLRQSLTEKTIKKHKNKFKFYVPQSAMKYNEIISKLFEEASHAGSASLRAVTEMFSKMNESMNESINE